MKPSAGGKARVAIIAIVLSALMVVGAVAVLGATSPGVALPHAARPTPVSPAFSPPPASHATLNPAATPTADIITTIPVETGAFDTAFDSANGTIFVTSAVGVVTVINGSSNIVVKEITVSSSSAGAAFDSANGDVYVSTPPSLSVTVINGTNETVIGSIAVGDGPSAVAFDSENGYLYVASTMKNGVTVINGASNTVVTFVATGSESNGLAYDSTNGYIYVANSETGFDNVSVINGTTDRLLKSIAMPQSATPNGVAFDGTNGCLYVGTDLGAVVINGSTNKVVKAISLPNGMGGWAVSFDSANGYVYMTSGSNGGGSYSVAVVNATDNTVVGLLTTGSGPTGITYDSSNDFLYVANFYSNSVAVLNGLPGVDYVYITSFAANPYLHGINQIVVGLPMNFTVTVMGGIAPLKYTYTGLPSGCASADTAVMWCTPEVLVGSMGMLEFVVHVFVNDSLGNNDTASTVMIVNDFYITSFKATPSAVDVGNATNLSATTAGGASPLNYTYTGLPPGCVTANASHVSCTPTVAGNYTVGVCVNDSLGNVGLWVRSDGGNSWCSLPPGSSSCSPPQCEPDTLLLTVNTAPLVSLSATPNPVDALTPVTFKATTSGGTAPFSYTWLINGTRASGQTVTYAFPSVGTYPVRVYANDSFGKSATDVSSVTVDPKLSTTFIVSNSTPLLGQTIALVASASGGAAPYSYAYVGLPPGCVSENKSAIGCLPTQSGTYNITVSVSDVNHGIANASLTLKVIFDFNVVVPSSTSAGSPFTISVNTNETFSGGTAVVPAAGFGAFTYNYSGLPPGCASEDASSITCTPTQVGTYHITISVHDQVGDHQTHTVVVNVVPAKSNSGILGLSGDTGYLVIGGAVAVAAALIAVLAIRSRKSRRDKDPDAPASPSASEPQRPPP